jgi:hypothetical protein
MCFICQESGDNVQLSCGDSFHITCIFNIRFVLGYKECPKCLSSYRFPDTITTNQWVEYFDSQTNINTFPELIFFLMSITKSI